MKAKVIMKQTLRKLKKASPAILAVASGVGVLATAVLSAKSTAKAIPIINEYDNEEQDRKKTVGTAKNVAKCYIPTAIVSMATISSIVGAHLINKHQKKELMGAYMALGTVFANYKSQVKKEYGAETEEQIQKTAEKIAEADKNDSNLITFTDCFKGETFEATMADVIAAEYDTNLKLQQEGYVTVNDFYKALGQESMNGGDEVGWSWYTLEEDFGLIWLPFYNETTKTDDGMEICVIGTYSDPVNNFLDY